MTDMKDAMSKPDRFDEEAEKLVGDICATDDIAAFGRRCHAEGLAQGRAEAFREAAEQMDKCRLEAQSAARVHPAELANKYIGKSEALWAAREYCTAKARRTRRED